MVNQRHYSIDSSTVLQPLSSPHRRVFFIKQGGTLNRRGSGLLSRVGIWESVGAAACPCPLPFGGLLRWLYLSPGGLMLKGDLSMRTVLLRSLAITIVNVGIVGFVSPIHVYAPTRASAPNHAYTRTHVYIPPGPPVVMYKGNQTLPEIALTFDDGPDPVYGPQIQAALERYQVPATFFYIGELVQRYPEIAARAENAGFVVGNHSWDHSDLPLLSSDQVQSELSQTNNAILKATGVRPTLMRPPYGAVTPAIEKQSAQVDLSTILWDVDTLDWTRPGANVIAQRVLTDAHDGAIVLLHEGGGDRSQTVEALAQIIPALSQRGYRFVTIPQMIADLH
jgi:peptidoglycan-N-acetylglucosamine deacetylase